MMKKGKIVGVCACPVGIAHTYMAADAIEAAAKKLGFVSKIETQGSSGIDDKLTASDIEEAELVVIATAVKLVDEERFNGYENKILAVTLKDVIQNAEQLIKGKIG